MEHIAHRVLAGALLAAAIIAPAGAQVPRGGNLPVQEMNFDLWCLEQAGLPPERCDKRSDADEAAFEAYRSKVEAYEIPYLRQKDNAALMDRDMLRADPIDRPVTQDPAQTQPNLNNPSTTAPPRP